MKIRPLQTGEEDAFVEMALASWLEAYRELLSEEDVAAAPDMMKTAVAKRFEAFRVAADEAGALLGYYSLGDGDYLWHLYVHPDHFRKGVGSMLLEAAEAEIRGRGETTVSLDVTKGNDRAVRFYEALGFRHDGVDEEGDTLMSKSLASA